MKQQSNRVKQYAGLAAAFLGTTATANAAVVYTDVDPDAMVEDTSYDIDLNGDGIIDVTLNQGGGSFPSKGAIINYGTISGPGTSASGYGFLAGSSVYGGTEVVAASSGVPVSAAASFLSGSPAGLGFATSAFFGSYGYGPWLGETNKYVGVKFEILGATHYGWIRMSVTPNIDKITVHDFAYQSTPGEAINTGEGAPTPTCDAPSGLTSTIINPTKVEVSWFPVVGADFYRIQGRPIGAPSFASIIVPGTTAVKSIAGLVSGTSYEWKMQARCPDGLGGFIISPETALENFTMPSPKISEIPALNLYSYKHSLFLNTNSVKPERMEIIDMTGRVVANFNTIEDQVEFLLPEQITGAIVVNLYHSEGLDSRKLIIN